MGRASQLYQGLGFRASHRRYVAFRLYDVRRTMCRHICAQNIDPSPARKCLWLPKKAEKTDPNFELHVATRSRHTYITVIDTEQNALLNDPPRHSEARSVLALTLLAFKLSLGISILVSMRMPILDAQAFKTLKYNSLLF